jgi:hypothetical protein
MLAGVSLAVATLAFLVPVATFVGTLRQWRFGEFTVLRESTPLAVLFQIGGTWWWRLSNHGERYVRPRGIEWIDVDPPEVAAEKDSMPWGIPPGGEVFVPALGAPGRGRRIAVAFEIVRFNWWRRSSGNRQHRAYMGHATVDPTAGFQSDDVPRRLPLDFHRLRLRHRCLVPPPASPVIRPSRARPLTTGPNWPRRANSPRAACGGAPPPTAHPRGRRSIPTSAGRTTDPAQVQGGAAGAQEAS